MYIRQPEVGFGAERVKINRLLERVFGLVEHAPVRIDPGDGATQFRERFTRDDIAQELRITQQPVRVPIPEFPVVFDEIGGEVRDLVVVDFHDQSVGFEIRIHPRDHIAFLDVKRVLMLVVIENHAREDSVDHHDALHALHADASILELHLGASRNASGLDILDVFLKRHVAVLLGWNPDRVAVEIAHYAHVRVIGERVLGDQVHIGADLGAIDHVGGHESSRIGTSVENGVGAHWLRIARGGVIGPDLLEFLGRKLVFEIGANSFLALELPVSELPAEVMTILFHASDDLQVFVVVCVAQHEGKREKGHGGDARKFNCAASAGNHFNPRQAENQPVGDPEGKNGVRLDVLHAADEERLHVELGVLKDKENDGQGQESEYRGPEPVSRPPVKKAPEDRDEQGECRNPPHELGYNGYVIPRIGDDRVQQRKEVARILDGMLEIRHRIYLLVLPARESVFEAFLCARIAPVDGRILFGRKRQVGIEG